MKSFPSVFCSKLIDDIEIAYQLTYCITEFPMSFLIYCNLIDPKDLY